VLLLHITSRPSSFDSQHASSFDYVSLSDNKISILPVGMIEVVINQSKVNVSSFIVMVKTKPQQILRSLNASTLLTAD